MNPNNDNNNNKNINLQDIKKIEIDVEDNNKEEPIDDLIFKEIMRKVQLDNLTKLILYGCNLNNFNILSCKNVTCIYMCFPTSIYYIYKFQ